MAAFKVYGRYWRDGEMELVLGGSVFARGYGYDFFSTVRIGESMTSNVYCQSFESVICMLDSHAGSGVQKTKHGNGDPYCNKFKEV